MEHNQKQPSENTDFTSKGRTGNAEPGQQDHEEESADISNMDQQEGELNNGTISKDQELFSGEKGASTSS